MKRLALVAVFAICGLALMLDGGPGDDPHSPYAEHRLYQETVERMQGGTGYYQAMDEAMRSSCITSDSRSCFGPVETARAFRTPTLFVAWRFGFPQWPGFVLLVLAAGIAASLMAPLAGPPVVLSLLALGWSRYTLPEAWAAALIVLAIFAYSRRRYWLAALLALLAVCIRELALPFIFGGLLAARRRDEPYLPWMVALVGSAMFLLWHMHAASLLLVGHGNEAPLLASGRPDQFVAMLAYGTGHALLGLVLWVGAAVFLIRDQRFADLLLPLIPFPLLGLFVARPYWAAIVVPVFVLFAACGANALLIRTRQPGLMDYQTPAEVLVG